ncbi:hypothetical protein BH10CYA1_BH10CYA1_13700 [soil metagenome]
MAIKTFTTNLFLTSRETRNVELTSYLQIDDASTSIDGIDFTTQM